MRRYFIKTKCKKKKCPGYKQCLKLSTEVHAVEGKVHTLFVGDTAKRYKDDNDVEQESLLGSGEQVLKRICKKKVGLNKKGYAITTLVRFSPRDLKNLDDYAKCCVKHLKADIKKLKPKRICFLGTEGLKHLVGIDIPYVSAGRGIIRKIEVEGRTYKTISTMPPTMTVGNVDLIGTLLLDVDRIVNNKIYKISKKFKVHRLTKLSKIKKLFKNLMNNKWDFKYLSFDMETDNVNTRYDNRLLSIGLSIGKKTWAIPLYHPETPFTPDEIKQIIKGLRKLAKFKGHFKWLAHFSKFDRGVLRSFAGIPHFEAPVLDTLSFMFLIDECRLSLRGGSAVKPFSLKYIAKNEFQYKGYEDEDVLEARADGDLANVNLRDHLNYVGEDAHVTYYTFQNERKMARDQGYEKQALAMLEFYYYRLFSLFGEMHYNGIYIDKYRLRDLKSQNRSILLNKAKECEEAYKKSKYAQRVNAKLHKERSGNRQPLFGELPWIFDINKDLHKQALFIDVMRIKPLKFGKPTKQYPKGQPSVDVAFQTKYKDQYKEVALLVEHSAVTQLYNLYVKKIWKLLEPTTGDCKDGKVRPNFKGNNVVSGRSAAADPNTQQLPRGSTPERKQIKMLFSAVPGRVILYCDVMTAEVRVWGQSSGDPNLCGIFRKGQKIRNKYRKNPTPKLKRLADLQGDFHTATAAEAYGVPLDIAKTQYRQGSKSISLGSMYGRGIKSIAKQIGVSEEKAQAIFDKIFENYPAGMAWFFKMEKFAEENHYVESEIGRRRRLYAFLTGDHWAKIEAKRFARNCPIQGYSSDLAFLGTTLILDHIRENDLDWKIENAVHDSIMVEMDLKDLREGIKVVERSFLKKLPKFLKKNFGVELVVPIEIDFEFGTNLGNLNKWDFSEAELKKILKKLKTVVKEEKSKTE